MFSSGPELLSPARNALHFGVRHFSQFVARKRSKYLFGSVLCCLMVVFAVGAKMALYQPQKAAKSIAATKAWQDHVPAIEAPVAFSAISFAGVLALVFALSFAPLWVIAQDEDELSAHIWFSPALSVRPPPVL